MTSISTTLKPSDTPTPPAILNSSSNSETKQVAHTNSSTNLTELLARLSDIRSRLCELEEKIEQDKQHYQQKYDASGGIKEDGTSMTSPVSYGGNWYLENKYDKWCKKKQELLDKLSEYGIY